MNDSNQYFEFDDDNFDQSVLSAKGVVMVDFFASWCGPCQFLSPTIEKLAQEYKGRALIGKYSTEENTLYAQKFDIRSIPCVKFWKDGKYQGEIIGVKSYQLYADTLDQLLKT
jgi:thioredoxin 1